MTEFPISLKSVDFNPASREPVDFAELVPNALGSLKAQLSWILSTQVFVDGIDTSHWNFSVGREIDFEVVKENGFDFVIGKATQGNWFLDDKFDRTWRACVDLELIPLVYHFFDDFTSGFEQAQWCLSNISEMLTAVDGKTIIFDDVEVKTSGTTQSQRQNRAKAFNETLDEDGFLTGNYSSKYLWESLMGGTPLSWVNKYIQWVAHWTPATEPLLPVGWTREQTKFWQYGISPTYSWAKKVGTDGSVDVNRFYGTIEDLKDLLGITVPPPADCCEEAMAILEVVQQDIIDLSNRLSGAEHRLDTNDNEHNDLYSKLNATQHDIEALAGNMQIVVGRLDGAEEDIADIVALIDRVQQSLCPK